jgi:hypothetical protein
MLPGMRCCIVNRSLDSPAVSGERQGTFVICDSLALAGRAYRDLIRGPGYERPEFRDRLSVPFSFQFD